MGVVSRKCKIGLILSQGQAFSILSDFKVLLGGQHYPTWYHHCNLVGYIFVSKKEMAEWLGKRWEIATILGMKFFGRWVHSVCLLLGVHVELSLAIVWRLSVY